MTTKIKWTFVLILAAVTLLTFITIIMINHTIRLKRIPEDENLTETVSADKLLATNHSVSVSNNIWRHKYYIIDYINMSIITNSDYIMIIIIIIW